MLVAMKFGIQGNAINAYNNISSLSSEQAKWLLSKDILPGQRIEIENLKTGEQYTLLG